METLKVVIEKDDTAEIGGSIELPGHFLLTTVGHSEQEVIGNLKMLVADFIAHEGSDYPEWNGVDAYKITYEVEYDLTSFIEHIRRTQDQSHCQAGRHQRNVTAPVRVWLQNSLDRPGGQGAESGSSSGREFGKSIVDYRLAR